MESKQVANFFSGLGQPTRFEILKFIAPHSCGENARGIPAGEIAKALNLPAATLSFHLKDMAYKELVVTRREGRKIYYRANLKVLLACLDEIVTHVLEPSGVA